MSVVIETSVGDITVDLYTQERPRCCVNFLKLCKVKYYNFCLFHSVQSGLVAQTGDPLGSGKGGESVFKLLYGDQAAYFDMEIKPRIKHTKLGHISMVNNGSNMHGSQFFLTLAPNIDYLDGKHSVFGEIVEGFDVLQKFNEVYVDRESRPYKDIRIYHTVVIDDPFDDPPGLESHIPDCSPQLTHEQLDSVRIGAEEDIDDTKGLKPEEVEEIMKEREAKAKAQILEMIGDLPDADAAPPDNVLFVCKLNPVTTEDDLEIIFSRFGKILSCEVIKDQKTNNSLQYAFIEFENPTDCENAYFKMDNVLIDDRRIHVDFSQSVAKLKWKGKGKGVEHVQEKSEGPRFRIKNPDERNDNKYDFVFDDEHEDAAVSADRSAYKKAKKSKKKRSRSNSSGEETRNRKRRDHVEVRDDKSQKRDDKSQKHAVKHSSTDRDGYRKETKSKLEVNSRETVKDRHTDSRRRSLSSSAEDRHKKKKQRSRSRSPQPSKSNEYQQSRQGDDRRHRRDRDNRDDESNFRRHGDSKYRREDVDHRHRADHRDDDDDKSSLRKHGSSSHSRRR